MSKTHTVKSGDRLYKLSNRYYGTSSKWVLIKNANPQLSGRKKASDGSPLIYPGDVLTIPDDTSNNTQQNLAPETISAESQDALSIIIDGNKFTFWTNYSLVQEMDTFDSFSFSSPFDISQDIYKQSFKPFQYKSVQVYYGNDLFFNGILLAPQSKSEPDSKTVSISGYPNCGCLNECCLPITSFPIEFNDQDLEKIAQSCCQPFGLTTEFSESAGNTFKKVSPEPEEKVLDFLIKLAGQRGFLISNNAQGNLLFWKTQQGASTATIKEGERPYLSCKPTFDPQNYYSHITGLLKTTIAEDADKYTWENTFLTKLGITRPLNYTVSDAESNDLETSVKAKAGRMFAASCGYRLIVQGHRNTNGGIWKKNTLITVNAPGAMIYKDSTFLIKTVNIIRDSDNGDTTILSLIFPNSYSGDVPTEVSWEG